MTKLTKEQIEQERVKFEERYSGVICLDKTEKGYFFSYEAVFAFAVWLARAELDKGE